MYEYKIDNIRVIDGDTIEADIHLGMNILLSKRKIRFYDLDTWETRGPNRKLGLAAKKALKKQIASYKTLSVMTIKDKSGKYGRLLGIIFGSNDGIVSHNLNTFMRNSWNKH